MAGAKLPADVPAMAYKVATPSPDPRRIHPQSRNNAGQTGAVRRNARNGKHVRVLFRRRQMLAGSAALQLVTELTPSIESSTSCQSGALDREKNSSSQQVHGQVEKPEILAAACGGGEKTKRREPAQCGMCPGGRQARKQPRKMCRMTQGSKMARPPESAMARDLGRCIWPAKEQSST